MKLDQLRELGIELSKIRDRLNALESCSDIEVKAWRAIESLFPRVDALEANTAALETAIAPKRDPAPMGQRRSAKERQRH